jgi:hypothetical protein
MDHGDTALTAKFNIEQWPLHYPPRSMTIDFPPREQTGFS